MAAKESKGDSLDVDFENEASVKGLSHGERAKELKKRARKLMQEAKAMEMDLLESQRGQKKASTRIVDLVDRLFLNKPLTPESAARTMREERWSSDLALSVLETLHARIKEASYDSFQGMFVGNETLTPSVAEQSAATSGKNATEVVNLLESYLDCFLKAVEIMDGEASNKSVDGRNVRWPERTSSLLSSRLRDLRASDESSLRNKFKIMLTDAVSVETPSVRRNLGLLATSSAGPKAADLNATARVIPALSAIPKWVPSSLLQTLMKCPIQLEKEQIEGVREILAGSNFHCTSSDSIHKAAIFRGNLIRDVNLSEAEIFKEIQGKLETSGLSKHVQLFFMPDHGFTPSSRNNAQEASEASPVLIAVPASVKPTVTTPKWKGFVQKLSTILTLISIYGYSVGCFALNPSFFNSIAENHDVRAVIQCLPLCGLIIGIHAVQEVARYFVAKKKGIKLKLPVPAPSTHLGSLGCITRMKTFPANRKDLFDVSMAGPVASYGVSLIMIMLGIRAAVRATKSTITTLPMAPTGVLQSSSIIGGILSRMAPKVLTMPTAQPIPMHSLFFAGYAGLISSALNMLPIFRLDGGAACTAATGSRRGIFVSISTILFIASFGLTSGLGNFWLIYVILCQRSSPTPCKDEVTGVGIERSWIWYASLALVAATLIPFPGGIALL